MYERVRVLREFHLNLFAFPNLGGVCCNHVRIFFDGTEVFGGLSPIYDISKRCSVQQARLERRHASSELSVAGQRPLDHFSIDVFATPTLLLCTRHLLLIDTHTSTTYNFYTG